MRQTISVALCTRNGARFVEAQLRSILTQTVAPDELVVSDDASTDATVATIERVMAQHDLPERERPIRLVLLRNTEPLGIAANFESAVRACTGDLIALSDQDDVWHSDRLASVVDVFAARHDIDLVFADATLIDGQGTPLGRSLFDTLPVTEGERAAVRAGESFSVMIKRNLATGATIALRRSLLQHALPFGEGWLHDEWLAIVAASVGGVDVVDRQLIDYRQHGANEIGVQQATIGYRVRRATGPRGDRNAGLARRSARLVDRLESLGSLVQPKVLETARMKARVENYRAALPAARLLRIAPVLAADRRGWYTNYTSQGRFEILRDLLQSHGG